MDSVYSRIGALLRLNVPNPSATELDMLLSVKSFIELHSVAAMLLGVPSFDEVMPK